jgi:hypothetical protein
MVGAIIASGPTFAADAMLDVKALSDIVAAVKCTEAGYRYMLRLGPRDVLCLRSNLLAAHEVDIQKAYPGLKTPAR